MAGKFTFMFLYFFAHNSSYMVFPELQSFVESFRILPPLFYYIPPPFFFLLAHLFPSIEPLARKGYTRK